MAPLRRNNTPSDREPAGFFARSGFQLSEEEFDLFRRLIHQQTGINLSDHKRELIVSRLAKRLRVLNLRTFRDYYEYLTQDPAGEEEMGRMINRITTNKTEFYRENHHFVYLREELLPRLIEAKERSSQRKLRVWSAACSTGEEPYTIAITIADFFAERRGWDLKILATDLDTEVLARASRGVYEPDRLGPVPRDVLARHFTPVPGARPQAYKVRPGLQEMILFRRFNLQQPNFPFKTQLDFIFCRNVMIYFNQDDKIGLLERFHQVLKPEGCIFVGHSESLMMVRHLFRYVKNTIYQKI